MPPSATALLTRLEAAKSRFGQGAAAETKLLITQLARRTFGDAKSLIRFHEALLFLRAFPHSPSIVSQSEKLLNRFHERVEKLRKLDLDMSPFDDFETSGIAGTTMQDTLNFEAARWLARQIPRSVEIAWGEYEEERAMGSTWPRFMKRRKPGRRSTSQAGRRAKGSGPGSSAKRWPPPRRSMPHSTDRS